ncbi:hypothetical protein M422DRAFT_55577 [Sphaerobolus stellatus SS14]|uniref:Unplaced genomic scaffold SPHSTscaffold_298, whole genome shotgun sequence n=1 Tax=Sphaerobolus stellatus (strain SS14) TaxID=990650 RepID=A0A0C9ULN1_SPHS4|nr:hypothetical protein M422DRAFT_55577 [Sphaerobolus stellatus SS14]
MLYGAHLEPSSSFQRVPHRQCKPFVPFDLDTALMNTYRSYARIFPWPMILLLPKLPVVCAALVISVLNVVLQYANLGPVHGSVDSQFLAQASMNVHPFEVLLKTHVWDSNDESPEPCLKRHFTQTAESMLIRIESHFAKTATKNDTADRGVITSSMTWRAALD